MGYQQLNMRAISGGNKAELLNLAPWANVELQLKALKLSGISGWSNLVSAIVNEWFKDISTNQVCTSVYVVCVCVCFSDRLSCVIYTINLQFGLC